MLRLLARLAPVFRLTRVTTAFAALANVWFVILWTKSNPLEGRTEIFGDTPLWLLLAGGAMVAVGLYSFAAALNDIVDYRRDRAFHPDRPLPSGQLSLQAAVAVVAGTLMAAILGSTVLGIYAVLLCLVTAGGILFFNVAARFVPSFGLVFLGLIYAGHMVIPNFYLSFLWPVWLVMTHSLLVAAATHVVGKRRPRLTRRAIIFSAIGWVFWSAVLLGVGWRRGNALWPSWVAWTAGIGPGVLAVVFVLFAYRKVRLAKTESMAADKLTRYGALWLALYNTGWMAGQRDLPNALLLGALAAGGFLGMTILRELYGLVEQPMGYRR